MLTLILFKILINRLAAKLVKPNINLLAVIVAIPVIGMTIISPALTLIKDELNISFSDTQLVLTLYFLFLAIGQIIAGPF